MQTLRNLIKIRARILRSYTFRVDTLAETGTSSSESYVPSRSGQPLPQNLNIAWPIWTASGDPGNVPWGS